MKRNGSEWDLEDLFRQDDGAAAGVYFEDDFSTAADLSFPAVRVSYFLLIYWYCISIIIIIINSFAFESDDF